MTVGSPPAASIWTRRVFVALVLLQAFLFTQIKSQAACSKP
jgi:hypothetical protein